MDQRILVEQAQHGDHDAFAVLARAAVGPLGGTARLILHDPELARDAVQEALIQAWRGLPGLRDPDRFDAWLYRLTVHACLGIARRRRRRAIEIDVEPVEIRADGDFPSAIADRDQLDRALRRLDPEHRALVVMHLYVGLPMPEVAAQLGIPLGTAKSRLNRSLATLRIAFEPTIETAGAIAEGGRTA